MLQRLSLSAVRRAAAWRLAHSVVVRAATCAPLLQSRRTVSGPSASAGAAAASTVRSSTSSSSAAQAGPELDAEAAEQVRLAQELGEDAFGENTAILKQVAMRGLRAFAVCGAGMGTFMWAMKRKKKELEAEARLSSSATAAQAEAEGDDPTQRYLEEMRGLGFDVDTLEEELEQERLSKAAVTGTATTA